MSVLLWTDINILYITNNENPPMHHFTSLFPVCGPVCKKAGLTGIKANTAFATLLLVQEQQIEPNQCCCDCSLISQLEAILAMFLSHSLV